MAPRGGPRSGAGRKPIPAPERRRNRLNIQLTDDELEQLEELAARESPALYARQVLLRHLAAKRRKR